MNTEIKEELILNLRQIDGFPLSERKDVFLLEFQKACKQAGFSLAEISSLTRINPQIVEWIYKGEFANLPSEVFVRGFLKSIAKLLELPPDVLANAYSRTIRDEVKPASGKAASGLGAHVSPAASHRISDSSLKNQSQQLTPEVQRPKSAKVSWNFDASEAKRPSDLGHGNLAQAKSDMMNAGLTDSTNNRDTDSTPDYKQKTLGDLPTDQGDRRAFYEGLATEATPNTTDTEALRTDRTLKSSLQADDELDSFDDPAESGAPFNQDSGVAKVSARGKKSRKTKESSNRSKTAALSPQVSEAKRDLSAVSDTGSPSIQPKVSGDLAGKKTFYPASQASKKPGKSVSFKIWSVLAGAAIILASIMWPRERAPNGTVIEEAEVIDLNAVKTSADQDPTVIGQDSSAGQEAVNSGVNTSERPGVTPVGNSPEGLVDSEAKIVAANFAPSSVVSVSAIPLPQGSWTPPAAMVLEITPKETAKLKAYIDGKPVVTESLSPELHKFEFNEKADLYLYDAAAVDIAFNGKNIGKVGNKGQFKRLSFVKTLK